MKEMKLIYLCCIFSFIGISGVFAQSGDKLLNILSGELNKQYRELQGEKPVSYTHLGIVVTYPLYKNRFTG